MNDASFDTIVIGGGIAGAAVAANLASSQRVAIIERESQPGYHSTGRSAAQFSEIYGGAAIRALSRVSRSFFFEPPAGFAAGPLVTARGSLFFARRDQLEALEEFANLPDVAPMTRRLSADETRAMCPLLRADVPAAGLFEPDAMDVDVHALHQGYLKLLHSRGGLLFKDAELLELRETNGRWRARTSARSLEASVIVNAAGAWVDEVARICGARPIGIEPRRRTVVVVDAPADVTVDRIPFTSDVEEEFYFKPDAGRLLVSPADETLCPPSDAQPDELDIAVAVDRFEAATIVSVRRLVSKWAGLRCFVADRQPVVGFDPEVSGFFWLAAQGGYGIQTSPALGRLASELARGRPVPMDFIDSGLEVAAISPTRLRER